MTGDILILLAETQYNISALYNKHYSIGHVKHDVQLQKRKVALNGNKLSIHLTKMVHLDCGQGPKIVQC